MRSISQSDCLYEKLFHNVNDVVMVTDRKGRILEGNDKARYIFGPKFMGQRIQRLGAGIGDVVESLKSANIIQSVHIQYRSEKGDLCPMKLTFVPVSINSSSSRLLVIGKDLKERTYFNEEIERYVKKITSLEKENQMLRNQCENSGAGAELVEALKKLELANIQLYDINKRLNRELELASTLQRSLVPQTFPDDTQLRIGSHFEPMGPVGGDYYDLVELPDGRSGLMLADVSGHGVSSAFIAAMLKISFMNHAPKGLGPAQLLSALNEEYCSLIQTGDYVTAFYTIFDPASRTMVYSGAGHPMSLFYHSRKDRVDTLKSEGFFLGMFDRAQYTEKSIEFIPGDKYLVYTDGIIEAFSENKEELFGVKRLIHAYKKHHRKPIDERLNAIIAEVKEFMQQSVFYDDLAMVAVDFVKRAQK
jgi:serine phosphatase RsbU (regulator of sigma subunit)